ncbi:MAG: General glycosylation pathway protein [Clostridia bacterium 41_269]|nr:MAG: General glycosylation pathway protein [Clostridia bacterium 41_269]
MPKISVIIPTIGRETLPRAVESVLNQTFQDFEIIITDDTEDERAKPIVEPYLNDPRVRYVVNRKYTHGPAGNKNNGLDHITGEYFCFVDDDDYIYPTALEELLTFAETYGYKGVFVNYEDTCQENCVSL